MDSDERILREPRDEDDPWADEEREELAAKPEEERVWQTLRVFHPRRL